MNWYSPTLHCRCPSPWVDSRDDRYHCIRCGHDLAEAKNQAITLGRRRWADSVSSNNTGGRTVIVDPLPPAPFRSWLDIKIAEYGHTTLLAILGWNRGKLHWIWRQAAHVDVGTVDQALNAEGSTSLHELYPGDE